MLKLFLMSFLTISVSHNLFCQTSKQEDLKEQVTKELCSLDSKKWILDVVIEKLGSSCVKGTTYTFSKSGKLVIRECVSKEWKITNTTWSFGKVDDLDINIIVNNEKFILLIHKHPTIKDAQEMILRKLSDSIPKPTIDKKFVYEED